MKNSSRSLEAVHTHTHTHTSNLVNGKEVMSNGIA